MSILVIEVVVRGLWGVIAVPTLPPLGRWTPGGSGRGRGRGRGRRFRPYPAPARSGALLLGRGRRRWRQGCCVDGEAEWSRVEIPRDAYQPRQPRPGNPHITYCCYCMAAAMLRTWDEKIDGRRSDHVAIACVLDRYTGTRICRLTSRRGERSRASITRPAVHLQSPATPPLHGSRRRNVRSRDYDCEAGRFLDVSMPGHLVSPLLLGGGGEWEVGWWHTPGRTSNRSEDPAISSHRGERQKKVVVPGWAVLPGCICTMLNDKKSGGQRRMRAVEGKMPAFLLHAHQS